MDFRRALTEQCKQRGGLRARRILRLLDAPLSSAKARRLQRIEDRVIGELKLGAGKIDWSKIDWSALFDRILELVLKFLPLFLGK